MRPVLLSSRCLNPVKTLRTDEDGNFVIGPDYITCPRKQGSRRRSAREGEAVHHRFEGDQALQPGHCSQGLRDGRSEQPQDPDRRNPPHRLQAQITVYIPAQYKRGGAAPFMVCHDGPKGKARHEAAAHPRQPDRPEARAGHDRDHDRQRRRRCPGAPARQGIRHDVRHVRRLHRDRGSAARGEELRCEALQRPRRPRGHGQQLRRLGGPDHGLVPHRIFTTAC